MRMNRHSIWEPSGFLIQATNKPGMFHFHDLNPEVTIAQRLSRLDRIKIGLWFLFQVLTLPSTPKEDK